MSNTDNSAAVKDLKMDLQALAGDIRNSIYTLADVDDCIYRLSLAADLEKTDCLARMAKRVDGVLRRSLREVKDAIEDIPSNWGNKFMLEEAVEKLAREDEDFASIWEAESYKFDSAEARWMWWHMLNGQTGDHQFFNGDDTVALELWDSSDYPELRSFGRWVGLNYHSDGSVYFTAMSGGDLRETEKDFEETEEEVTA